MGTVRTGKGGEWERKWKRKTKGRTEPLSIFPSLPCQTLSPNTLKQLVPSSVQNSPPIPPFPFRWGQAAGYQPRPQAGG